MFINQCQKNGITKKISYNYIKIFLPIKSMVNVSEFNNRRIIILHNKGDLYREIEKKLKYFVQLPKGSSTSIKKMVTLAGNLVLAVLNTLKCRLECNETNLC